MPLLDTDFLFALNPLDRKHAVAISVLKQVKRTGGKEVAVSDTALFEFYLVLRSKGKKSEEISFSVDAIHTILSEYGIVELATLNTKSIRRQILIEERYGLGFFDAMLTASAEAYDRAIISDDKAYDRVKTIRRVPYQEYVKKR